MDRFLFFTRLGQSCTNHIHEIIGDLHGSCHGSIPCHDQSLLCRSLAADSFTQFSISVPFQLFDHFICDVERFFPGKFHFKYMSQFSAQFPVGEDNFFVDGLIYCLYAAFRVGEGTIGGSKACAGQQYRIFLYMDLLI